MTYEQLQKANESIKTVDINKKPYAEVNQRIKAFRQCYPEGFILTELVSDVDGICIFRAEVGYYEDKDKVVLATGTAFEREGSTFINKTSYIENCETSAVGRALGMAGFGIDTSVASAEEVQNAIANQDSTQEQKPIPQEKKASPKQVELLRRMYSEEWLCKACEANNVKSVEELSMRKASEYISQKEQKK